MLGKVAGGAPATISTAGVQTPTPRAHSEKALECTVYRSQLNMSPDLSMFTCLRSIRVYARVNEGTAMLPMITTTHSPTGKGAGGGDAGSLTTIIMYHLCLFAGIQGLGVARAHHSRQWRACLRLGRVKSPSRLECPCVQAVCPVHPSCFLGMRPVMQHAITLCVSLCLSLAILQWPRCAVTLGVF